MSLLGSIRSKKGAVYYVAHLAYDVVKYLEYGAVFSLLRWMPLKNKVVATAFNGEKYGDNAKYIIETLHAIDPELEIVWFCDPAYSAAVPDYVRKVDCTTDRRTLRRIYHYATSKVWINTHLYEKYLFKRKGQLVIETWHGGLGIKKIEGDVEKFHTNKFQMRKIRKSSALTDVYTSNCDFLSRIYRRAFFYPGLIWNAGFPKNDLIVQGNPQYKEKVHDWFGIPEDTKIVVYAPTYRGAFEDNGQLDLSPYDIDLEAVVRLMEQRFGGTWIAMVRWHPSMALAMKEQRAGYSAAVLDGSPYPEMQEIIAASDAFISDYSSCLFDAALKEIPCFIYANDFDEYLGDRGSYFQLRELPFPYAADMDELAERIRQYKPTESLEKWRAFCGEMGLRENGNAAEKIAKLALAHIRGKNLPVSELIPEKEKYGERG